MAAFASLKERVILDLANNLKFYTDGENYNIIDEVNFYLKFVQNIIPALLLAKEITFSSICLFIETGKGLN